MIIEQLVEFSNKYGSDSELVLAGGGNTSAKDGNVLYIKGSGTSLASITANEFVKMDRRKLAEIFEKNYPQDDKQREALALEDLMAARVCSELNKRPSVETTLHSLFPQSFVLHLHPALVNGLTCAIDGKKIAEELFGDDMIWVGLCRPGYVLAKLCNDLMKEYLSKNNKPASMILLQNHGIFIASDDIGGLGKKLESVMNLLKERVHIFPDLTTDKPIDDCGTYCKKLSSLYCNGAVTLHSDFAQAIEYTQSKQAAIPLLKPFTPDHIVYCKAHPLFINSIDDAQREFESYKIQHGYAPKIVMVKGLGYFSIGANEKEAKTAQMLFKDAIKIAVYSRSFGGILPMTDELVDFIVNWEVESYRQKIDNKK